MQKTDGQLPRIDLKDRKILRVLDMDVRMPIKQLARKVGVSRQVAQYRIERMMKEGVISGFLAIFDSAAVGKRWFRVVVQLRRISAPEKKAFIDYFKSNPHVVWLGEVGGNWDFVINMVSDDQFSFDRLFSGILERWGAYIQRYEILVYINVRDRQRAYILPEYEPGGSTLFHEMKFNRVVSLDALDRRIIREFSKNASLSYSEIASKLSVSYKTVQNRMEAMMENRILLGYRAMINPNKLGHESYMLFLGTNAYDAGLEKQLDEFLNHPNVTFVVRQLGRWRIGLEAEFGSREEFQKFLIELRTRFGEMISEYETFPIFHDHVIDYFPPGALDDASGSV
jgi:DNA-binding Lrp family transcriptional regulator